MEVSLSAYMNANNLESLKFGPLTAAPSPTATTPTPGAASASNMASNANRNIRDIPEEEVTNCDLPPTIKLLVYLWDEIKSYCIQVRNRAKLGRKKFDFVFELSRITRNSNSFDILNFNSAISKFV